MNAAEFQAEALKTWTAPLRGTPEGLEYLRLGLVSEVGEVAGVLKRIIRDGWPVEVWRPKLVLELGDVAWYAVVYLYECQASGWLDVRMVDHIGMACRQADGLVFSALKARMTEANITWAEVFDAVIAKLRDRQARGVIKGEGDNR